MNIPHTLYLKTFCNLNIYNNITLRILNNSFNISFISSLFATKPKIEKHINLKKKKQTNKIRTTGSKSSNAFSITSENIKAKPILPIIIFVFGINS